VIKKPSEKAFNFFEKSWLVDAFFFCCFAVVFKGYGEICVWT